MEKRGQIALFLIIAVSLILISGLVYYAGGYKKTGSAEAQITDQKSDESAIVKSFAENCIKKSAEDTLFNRIGLQGGFINLNGDARYGEIDTINSPINPPTTSFSDGIVPYYYGVNCEAVCNGPNGPDCTAWKCTCQEDEYFPDLESIRAKLKHYIEAEFDKCFDQDIFKSVGIEVIKPVGIKANADVSLNAEYVTIKLSYPLIIKQDSTETELESFIAVLPIRIKALYDSSKDFVAQVRSKVSELRGKTFSGSTSCTVEYNIIPHCQNPPKYDKNGLTNVYFKNGEIVQFVDFSTYEKKYLHSYIFQFALKNVNVDGVCAA